MKGYKKICSIVITITMIMGLIPAVGDFKVSAAVPAIGRHEVEDADSFTKGSAEKDAVVVEDANFSGGKAVENMNTWPDDGRAYSTTTVTATEAGTYELTIGYSGGEAGANWNIDTRINNGDWISTVAEVSGGWNTVATVSLNVNLVEGDNVIDITGACNVWQGEPHTWEWIILDYFELEKVANENNVSKTAKELKENSLVNFRGRTTPLGEAIGFDYTNSGFEFNYAGKGTVRANLTTTGNEKFAVDVDGTLSYISVNAKTENIVLAKNLEDGNHTIKVYKSQEAAFSLAQLNSLSYDADATLTPIEHDYKFEFVGDSITCGNQIDPVSGAENGYPTYASVLARSYNADWSTVSASGRGLMQGYNSEASWIASKDNQLNKMFEINSYFRSTTEAYDYSYNPDVLVVNVGSNDLGGHIMNVWGTSITDFTNEVKVFHNKVRAKYPNTKIIWCYGSFLNRLYENEYRAAVEGLNDANAKFVYFPQMVGGTDGHPNYIQHERMAKMLSKEISAMLGITNPMGEDLHYEAEIGTITGGGNVKTETFTSVDQASPYSQNSYVADLNDTNGTKYVTIPVNVAKAGTYRVAVSYGGSDGEPVIKVKANAGVWKAYNTSKGASWDDVLTFDASVYMYEGNNTISITGDTTGNWANIDCIDLTYLGEGTPEEQEPTTPSEPGTTPSEPGTTPSDVPSDDNEPTTPSQTTGATRYEAENADSFTQGSAEYSYTIENSDKYSNGQAVGNMNFWPENGRAYCTTNVTPGAGIYKLVIGYAGGEANHPCNIDVRVNGGSWVSTLAPVTEGWDVVQTIELTVDLVDGNNTIDITGASNIWYADMGWEWVNIDYFELTKIGEREETTTPSTSVENTTTQAPTTINPTTAVSTTKPYTVKKPSKTTVKKAIKKNRNAKKVSVLLKKVSKVKGYQIQISTNRKFKKTLVNKTYRKIKVTISNKRLKGKRKLYIRARAYRIYKKNKIWGSWSKAKRVKI